jgi:hypothetical protein
MLLASCLLLAPVARAQSSLLLEQTGGGIGQDVTFELTGDPNRPYVVWFDLTEVDTPFPTGITTNVGFDYLDLCLSLPGFLGTTNAAGRASATVGVPNDPAFADLRFAVQAVFVDQLDTVSNMTRVTPAISGTFRDTLDQPKIPILSGLASPQSDGTILVVDTTLPLVHRYTPSLEEFEIVNVSCALGLLATATTLPDGRILVSGGIDPQTWQPQTRCILFDPATQTCKDLQLATPRAGHAAATLKSGKLMISGGFTTLDFTDVTTLFQGITTSVEIFDPVSETFAAGKDLPEPKAFHAATTDAAGKVLVSGGLTLVPILNVPFVSQLAWTYDGTTDKYGLLPLLMNEGRLLHGGALLDDKTILLAGGVTVDFSAFLSSGNLADLVLTAMSTGDLWKTSFFGGTFTKITGMQSGRALPSITALPGAQALIAGGFDLLITGTDLSAWVFDPKTTADRYAAKAFSATGSMKQARIAPIAVMLSDGTVLVIGGNALGAEIYQP